MWGTNEFQILTQLPEIVVQRVVHIKEANLHIQIADWLIFETF